MGTTTNVHDPANWTYILEGQGETIDAPRSPPMAEYVLAPLSPRFTVLSNNFSLQQPDMHTQLAELRMEVA